MSPLDFALPMTADHVGGGLPPLWRSRLPAPPAGPYIPGQDEAPDTYTLLLAEMQARLAEAARTIAAQQERIDSLEALTMTDELTGLLNRRGFQDAFRRELAAGRRTGIGGVLVMIDLDGFKAINDTHGHLAGDHYLQQIARALKDSVRANDIVARLGGDEFVVLLTRVDAEQGLARAAELADRVNAGSCDWKGVHLPLRASFGPEVFSPSEKAEDVVRRADVHMYTVKSKRRKAAR